MKKFDVLGVNANRNWYADRGGARDFAQGQPVNKLIPAKQCRNPICAKGWQIHMIKKLLLALKKKDATQQHQFFQTKCTVNSSPVGVIINSGSCKNNISKETIEILK